MSKIYKILLTKNALEPTSNFCRSEDSTTTLGSSFHSLVVLGMKLLEYWVVLNLIGVKALLFEFNAFLVTR